MQIAGSLGIALGGQKRVEVANRNSYVYVQLRDNPNEVIQAYNNKVAPSYGLPVILEWQNNRYTVQGVDSARYQNNWNSFTPFLPRHGNTHTFDDGNTGGGGDIVWVYPRQFIPSLIIPSGSTGASNVLMSQYTIKNADGSWRFVGNTGTQSMIPYIPSTGTQAVMVLVYMDSISGNPYLMVGSGSYFANTITGSADVVPYIPTLSNPNYIPLAAVRLVTGTSTIRWSNIYDVRQFIHTTPTGSGGGGISDAPVDGNLYGRKNAGWTIITGSGGGASGSDSTYYRLDTTNNPLTGRIIIRPSGTNRWTADPTVAGTGTNTLIDGDQTLSNDGNLLLLANKGSPKTKIAAQGNLEFGLGSLPSKESNAGKIGYELFSSGYLEIVGAGTSAPNRWIRTYDNLKVDSHLQTNTVQTLNLKSAWPYADATGTFVSPGSAPDISATVSGTSYFLGTDPSFNSGRILIDSLISYLKSQMSQVIQAASGPNNIAAGQTRYFGIYYMDATESLAYVPMGKSGWVRNLRVYSQGSPGVGQTYTCTLRNTLADTTITCTIVAGTNTASDTTHSEFFSSTDRWALKVVSSASAATTNIVFSFEFFAV